MTTAATVKVFVNSSSELQAFVALLQKRHEEAEAQKAAAEEAERQQRITEAAVAWENARNQIRQRMPEWIGMHLVGAPDPNRPETKPSGRETFELPLPFEAGEYTIFVHAVEKDGAWALAAFNYSDGPYSICEPHVYWDGDSTHKRVGYYGQHSYYSTLNQVLLRAHLATRRRAELQSEVDQHNANEDAAIAERNRRFELAEQAAVEKRTAQPEPKRRAYTDRQYALLDALLDVMGAQREECLEQ